MAAEARPFPSEETTPPVMKIYRGMGRLIIPDSSASKDANARFDEKMRDRLAVGGHRRALFRLFQQVNHGCFHIAVEHAAAL